jgi:hypothetical protein
LAGVSVSAEYRKHGFSGASFWDRKTKFNGFGVSEAKVLRSLEDVFAAAKQLPCQVLWR